MKTRRKDVVIPKNSCTVVVSCCANTGPVHKQVPVLFVADTLAQFPEGLEASKTFLNIYQEKHLGYKLRRNMEKEKKAISKWLILVASATCDSECESF